MNILINSLRKNASHIASRIIALWMLLLVPDLYAVAQGSSAAYVHIAAGSDFSFAIQSNGTLWAWGDNLYGELGDGTFISRNQPVAITDPVGAAPGSRWIRIFANVPSIPVYALRSDQTFWRWGANQTRPVQVPLVTTLSSGATLADLSITQQHFLALYSDGSLYSWGSNSQGQLGIGTAAGTGTVATPTPVLTPTTAAPGTRWTAIEADANQSFAVRSDGTLWSWGGVPNTIPSTLGHPVTAAGCFTPELVPAPAGVSASTGWVSVAAGETHTLGLRSDGTLWGWGISSNGALGLGVSITGTAAPLQIPVPAGLPAGTRWQRVEAGNQTSQGILSDGTLWAWGNNFFGQLGVNSSYAIEAVPLQEYNQETWTQSALGVNHAVGLSRGRVYVTGNGPNGQLGLGNATSRLYFFVRVVGLPLASKVVVIASEKSQVFPNPAAAGEQLTVTLNSTDLSSSAEFVNSQGHTSWIGPVNSNQLTMPQLTPGLYVIRFFAQKRFLASSKIVVW